MLPITVLVQKIKVVLFFLLCFSLFYACGKKYTDLLPNSGLSATISFYPNTGFPNTQVTIIGSGFNANSSLDQVFFNGTPASVLRASADTLIVESPSNGSNGPVSVKVGSSQVTGSVFTYLASNSVFQLSPSAGNIGDIVLITTNPANPILPGSSLQVIFTGGVSGIILSHDTHNITVRVPQGFNNGPITLMLGSQKFIGSIFSKFSIDPLSSQVIYAGETITLTGAGFNSNPLNNIVYFYFNDNYITLNNATTVLTNPLADSLILPVISGNNNSITFKIPNFTVQGPIYFKISNSGSNFLTIPNFTFLAARLNTCFSGFTYTSGSPCYIKGAGFTPGIKANKLTLNGLNCTITYASADSIVYILPNVINPTYAGTITGPLILNTGNLLLSIPILSTTYQNPTGEYVFDQYLATNSFEEVSTLAGGSYGLTNGTGRQAEFESLSGIAIDFSGNIYVTDAQANNIRKINPVGVVSNFAGSPQGIPGYQDGFGTKALFNHPKGISFDGTFFYVADSGNFRIRKVDLNGIVSTLAGSGIQGNLKGTLRNSSLQGPVSVFANSPYYLLSQTFFYDQWNGFTPGTTGDLQGIVYFGDYSNGKGVIKAIIGDSVMTIFNLSGYPSAIGYLSNGGTGGSNYLNFINQTKNVLEQINDITTLNNATQSLGTFNQAGYIDNFFSGTNKNAFNASSSIVSLSLVSGDSKSYISDQGNNSIRFAYENSGNVPPAIVGTLVGGGLNLIPPNNTSYTSSAKAGYVDGGFNTALFNKPGAMVVDDIGNIFVCDIGNQAIRKIILFP